jgi:antitoxin (DNA-binding transcriptional repressor) of toxin-antitoxin stability system
LDYLMQRMITVTEASRGFADLINRARYRRESAVLMRGGKPVAKIVPVDAPAKTGGELASLWPALPHLDLVEAEALAHDLKGARDVLPLPANKWD